MSASYPRPNLSPVELTAAWQSASLLLEYPDEQLLDRVVLLRDAAAALPARVAQPLSRFLDYLERTPTAQLCERYVKTFDHQRRCCLYLTYFAHGDTRKRGMALLGFKQAYGRAGLSLCDDELPDHLAVVLEFGATRDSESAWRLLLDHRAGLELLRLALRDTDSPWVDVVTAVTQTLPELKGDDHEMVMRLAMQGPPDEEVGLAPFAPPEYIPPGNRPAPDVIPVESLLASRRGART